MIAEPIQLSVVIPTWNGRAMLARCLSGLAAQTIPVREVVVVDNGSDDGTEGLLQGLPEIRSVHFDSNEGFSVAVNAGIRASVGEFVVLLNNDAIPEPEWHAALLAQLADAAPSVGFLSSKLLSEDGATVESLGDYLDRAAAPRQMGHGEPDDGRFEASREILSGCGAATAYRRAMLDQVGLFDERFFAYYEDIDLCLRARLRGWTGLLVPTARVRHRGSATSDRVPGMKARLLARNGWWVILKDVPSGVLGGVLLRHAAGSVRRAGSGAVRGTLRHQLVGHGQALAGLRGALRDRRKIQAESVVNAAQFRAWLGPSAFGDLATVRSPAAPLGKPQ